MIQRDTIPSRALEIWRRLYTRFSLEPGPASVVPDVSKTIWPVTVVDSALLRSEGESKALDLSVTVGTFVSAITVRQGQAWTLTFIGLRGTTGNAAPAVKVGTKVIRMGAESTAGEFFTLRMRLVAGDQLGAEASGNAADDARTWDAMWEVEDV